MGPVNRQIAEIERRYRALADSPWGPPQPPRGRPARHLRAEDFDTPAERVLGFLRRMAIVAAIVCAGAAAIALLEAAMRL
jgi:hypothetical protein